MTAWTSSGCRNTMAATPTRTTSTTSTRDLRGHRPRRRAPDVGGSVTGRARVETVEQLPPGSAARNPVHRHRCRPAPASPAAPRCWGLRRPSSSPIATGRSIASGAGSHGERSGCRQRRFVYLPLRVGSPTEPTVSAPRRPAGSRCRSWSPASSSCCELPLRRRRTEDRLRSRAPRCRPQRSNAAASRGRGRRPRRRRRSPPTGQLPAAAITSSTDAPSGSTTTALSSSSSWKTSGAVSTQSPEPMQSARSTVISIRLTGDSGHLSRRRRTSRNAASAAIRHDSGTSVRGSGPLVASPARLAAGGHGELLRGQDVVGRVEAGSGRAAGARRGCRCRTRRRPGRRAAPRCRWDLSAVRCQDSQSSSSLSFQIDGRGHTGRARGGGVPAAG